CSKSCTCTTVFANCSAMAPPRRRSVRPRSPMASGRWPSRSAASVRREPSTRAKRRDRWESDVAFDLTALLGFANDEGASDLHISAGLPPLVRIRGEIVRLELPALSRDDAHGAIY